MTSDTLSPLLITTTAKREHLTPKSQILADYVTANPKKAVFMTIRELAAVSGVSQASVVRFVNQLGFSGFGEFIQSLRNILDTELTLPDRIDLKGIKGSGADRFQQVVSEEIDNLRLMYKTIDLERIEQVVQLLNDQAAVYAIGSRLSFTVAYYFGWSLTKIRPGVHILKGSDSVTLDRLVVAPDNSIVVLIATARYPNELIRIAKRARHLGHRLIVLTDSEACPLIQFAHQLLIAPSRHIPFIGSPTSLCCLINYLLQELAGCRGNPVRIHQKKLEQAYRENDILFNM